MSSRPTELCRRAAQLARHPRTRKFAIWLVSIVAAIGLIALVAPPLLRQKISAELSKKLHRNVAIEQIRLNPYTMSATVRGFSMKDKGSTPAFSFDELYVNIEALSLLYRGIVIKRIQLVKPYVHLIRNEDRTYNFTDLIEEFTKGPPGPTPRFSLSNIEVIDGRLDFDDRPEGVNHSVTSVRLGLPFLSSLPYHADIKVRPAFSALVNGAPVGVDGEAKPFQESPESTIHLKIDNLQVPKYLEYSPVELKFKVPSGNIDGNLTASFRSSKNKPAVLVVSGRLALQNLLIQEADSSPILTLPAFEVVIDALEVFAGKAGLKSIKAQAPELHVTRQRDGTFNLSALAPAGTAGRSESVAAETKQSAPFSYTVEDISVDQATIDFSDRRQGRPFRKKLENVRISIKGLSNEPDKKAKTEISFQTDAKEQFTHSGGLQITPLAADGMIEIEKFQLKELRPYYETFIGAEIREGFLDLSGHFAVEIKGQALNARVSELNAALQSLRMDLPGKREPLWRVPLISLKETAIDVGAKTVVIGAFEARNGSGFIDREPDGTFSYARLVKTQSAGGPADRTEPEGIWRIDAKRIALDRMRIIFEDRSASPRSRIVLSELYGRADNFSNAKNTRGKATLRARINDKGSVSLSGAAGLNPIAGQFNLQAEAVSLLALQPYLTDRVNFLLTGGQMGTKGTVSFDASGNEPVKIGYSGNLEILDFSTVEKDGSQDLLKWKSVALTGLRFSLEPMQLRIDEIALADFYSRLIIGADGKTNLQKLTVEKKQTESAQEEAAPPPAPSASAAPAPGENRTTIGKIHLKGGNIHFSDFFIKPNYSANLTGVQGMISELRAETPGELEIQASLDNAAPVDIRGKINPLSKDLYLDITADAREIELSPFSPYSGKYVGYGIERGKLSFKVKYKLEDRKLEAQNQIILNQLTFGERVESPDATKLPVQLAVALLKDRNGVIDVNLPIGGSLDDPQFSVGGIVLRIIINIITKAVTAPFALLGAAFGGGGEELSTIEFDYGRANLSETAQARIKTLAAAMNNRPGLKLEISASVDPIHDLEGVKRAGIERKVKAQKMKELMRQGKAPQSVDDVRIESNEYERYLKAAYGEESFPKPRNIIGFAKALPVAEMEALMFKHAQATEGDLKQLAQERAQVVRDFLLASGQVTGDRLFMVVSKPLSGEEKTKVRASRVDFALK